MDDTKDLCNIEGDGDGDGRNSSGVSSSTAGKAADIILWNLVADIILWKRWHVSCGIIVVATIAWLLVERSGLSFLSLCSDVMLFLIVLLFLQANFAVFRHEKLQKLPKLVLSEEMVNNAAASFCLKVNHALLMAHNITFGIDFRLFFQVVVCLWLLSGIAYTISFFTLAYIGIILSITVPALYNKYQEHVDLFAGQTRQRVRNCYNLVDESIISRIRRTVAM